MRTFRAATLNIWGRFGPYEQRIPVIREALADLAPDVIGMQEVLRHPGFDELALVTEGLDYIGTWGQSSDNHGFPVGNAIVSKWPALRSGVYPLPNIESAETRSLVFAEIDSPYGKIPFFCTHLNWRFEEGHVRVKQVRFIAEKIEELVPIGSPVPPLLVGDFNAEPDSDEIRFLRGLTGFGGPCVYYSDAFAVAGDGSSGATFSKRNPFAEPLREPERRIDYVFSRGPDEAHRGETRDARVCFDRPYGGIYPSDHFGVIATITAGR